MVFKVYFNEAVLLLINPNNYNADKVKELKSSYTLVQNFLKNKTISSSEFEFARCTNGKS